MRLGLAAGLQRGHGRGASLSKPRIRVAWSHSPHHDGRATCCVRGGGSSAGDSRAASTAYGFRTPTVLVPVKAASACGVQPASRVVVTAGASLARWAAVSGQSAPSAAKNSPARASRAGAQVAGSWDGSLYGSVQWPHPVDAPVAGGLPAPVGRHRGQIQCPRDRPYAHRPPPGPRPAGRATRQGVGSVLGSFTPSPRPFTSGHCARVRARRER